MEKKTPTKEPGKKVAPHWNFPLWYLPLMLLLLWMWQGAFGQFTVQTIPYSQFKEHLANGEVVEVAVRETEVTGTIRTNVAAVADGAVTAPTEKAPLTKEPAKAEIAESESDEKKDTFLFRTVRVEDPNLVEELQAADVKFVGVRPSFLTQMLLAWVLPIGLLILLWIWLSRKMSGAGQGVLSVGKSKAKLAVDKDTGVNFNDVAGCEEAKFELREVVDFLQNPQRYKSIGAKIPKGVLLVGPPGTGKTLLARAVAGEAKVPFFFLTGSDFVEMFVGVGAARVRDLFQQAKAQAPCIVFIDELDAIGRQRGVHIGTVNDEREQTLNQLLVEMDGFEANVGVIILSATNRPEVLDRALLRPGRFDRQVIVDSPDVDGREAILKVHTKGKPLAADVNLRRIAQSTPGFSGADLANAVNEAALLAARHRGTEIAQKDLEDAVEKVVAGPERKTRRMTEDQKRRVAYHEVGHALVAAHSEHSDPVHKISIVPRGRAALGYTMQLPTDDQYLLSRSELLDRMRGMLGGRAAEELVFNEITTGAENDIERATAMARQMVCIFGMNDKIGLVRCAQRANNYLPSEQPLQRDCSEQTAREVDEEVKKLLDRAYAEAKEILAAFRQEMEHVTEELMKTESLDGDTFYGLIGQKNPRDAEPRQVAIVRYDSDKQ
ncbi:MAG: ATP-dependent metallopeptidase FtsH/Yme1/Tma family protein [Verrucomicrobia bacterium]|nr:ATP-dependent metallopeptidase FtsH/Yme1/Tma family protein [Verrucomicrobiota bacterium]